MNIILYFVTLITLVVLDSTWLFTSVGFYRTELAHLFAAKFSLFPAAIFYLLYAVAIIFFVISPALRTGASWKSVAFAGAFLGFIAYAAYDLTNQATLMNWPIAITVVDMAWGTILTALTSTIAYLIYTHFIKH